MSSSKSLNKINFFPFLIALGCFAGAGLIVSSCSTTMNQAMIRTPQVEGAAFVGNEACLTCHEQITQQFAASEHGRFHKRDLAYAGMTGCESCHGAGSKHVDAGGGRGVFIVNPASNASACLDCHTAQHAEFTLPHRHMVKEGAMNCTDCHEPHGSDIFKPSGGLLAMSRLNESCTECHLDQGRPFVFEHEALREGCTTCHQPHGSVNDKMLVERDANLCLKCHAQVASPGVSGDGLIIGRFDHSGNIMQGTCWSAGCHEAVHGSNIHPRLLY